MTACADNQPIVEQLLTAEGINVMLKNYAEEDAQHCAVSQGHFNTNMLTINHIIKHDIRSIYNREDDDEMALDLRGRPRPLY